MPGKQIYAVGIHHRRAPGIFKQGSQHPEGPWALPQARANEQGIHFGEPLQDLREGIFAEHPVLLRQGKDHRLVELHGLNGIDALRNPQVYKACPGPESTHGREPGGSRKAPAAAQQQKMPEVTLVGVAVPPGEKRTHLR